MSTVSGKDLSPLAILAARRRPSPPPVAPVPATKPIRRPPNSWFIPTHNVHRPVALLLSRPSTGGTPRGPRPCINSPAGPRSRYGAQTDDRFRTQPATTSRADARTSTKAELAARDPRDPVFAMSTTRPGLLVGRADRRARLGVSDQLCRHEQKGASCLQQIKEELIRGCPDTGWAPVASR